MPWIELDFEEEEGTPARAPFDLTGAFFNIGSSSSSSSSSAADEEIILISQHTSGDTPVAAPSPTANNVVTGADKPKKKKPKQAHEIPVDLIAMSKAVVDQCNSSGEKPADIKKKSKDSKSFSGAYGAFKESELNFKRDEALKAAQRHQDAMDIEKNKLEIEQNKLKTEEKKSREGTRQKIIEIAMNKDWDADRTSEYLRKMGYDA